MALEQANDGDQIFVCPGTYAPEQDVFLVAKRVLLSGYRQGPGSSWPVLTGPVTVTASAATVQFFTINATCRASQSAIFVSGADGVKIRRNVINNGNCVGVALIGTRWCRVRDNTINGRIIGVSLHSVGGPASTRPGLENQITANTITAPTVGTLPFIGILCYIEPSDGSELQDHLLNNTVVGFTYGIALWSAHGSGWLGMFDIRFNLIVGCFYGIWLGQGNAGHRIASNIITNYGNGTSGVGIAVTDKTGPLGVGSGVTSGILLLDNTFSELPNNQQPDICINNNPVTSVVSIYVEGNDGDAYYQFMASTNRIVLRRNSFQTTLIDTGLNPSRC